jgi:hypothetical protein
VLERLASELEAGLAALPGLHRLVVWFDPAGECERLLDPLSAELSQSGIEIKVHREGESQLDTKLWLLNTPPADSKRVLYMGRQRADGLLPLGDGRVPPIWSLVEYRWTAVLWSGLGRWAGVAGAPPVSLAQWLQRQGVTFADERTVGEVSAGGASSLLTRYVAIAANEDPTRWTHRLRVRDLLDAIVGSPRDRLMQLVVLPAEAVSAWGESAAEILDRIGQEYGLTTVSAEPETMADDLVAGLALTEAWDAYGRGDDFPFAARLPRGPQQRERLLGFIRGDLLRRSDVAGALRSRVARLEPAWGALDGWAGSRSGQSAILTGLTRRRLGALIADLRSASTTERSESVEGLRAAAASDLASMGPLTGAFTTVRSVVRLATAASDAIAHADQMTTAAALFQAYAAPPGWAAIDGDYLRVQAATEDEAWLRPLRELADHLYFDYVAKVNDRLWSLLEERPTWPPHGMRRVEAPAWDATSKGRRAVIITDALRLDIAQEVSAEIGPSCVVTPGLTTLPTTTPFGMAALLPTANPPTGDLSGGRLQLRASDGTDLASRAGRREFLVGLLSGQGASVAFLELDDVLGGSAPGTAALTVVFDYALDDRGHGQGSLPKFVPDHVRRVARAVDQLHALGHRFVEIVTDHGFLHLPPELIDDLGHPDLPAKQVFEKKPRHAILKPDAPVEGVLRVTSPLTPDVMLGFPRGIRTFIKADAYLHGGISLQECVVARLVSESAAPRPRLKADVTVSTSLLTSGTIVAKLRPLPPEGQLPLGGVLPLRLELWVESAADPAVLLTGEPVKEELRLDTPEVTRPLYLAEGRALPAGTRLQLRARDAETKEDVASVPLTLAVDWE